MLKRSRGKLFMGGAAVLFVSITAVSLLLSRPEERKVFVGNVDPVTGYRCWFTIPASWQSKEDNSKFSIGIVDNVSFSAPTPGSLRRWIDAYLFRRPTPVPAIIRLNTFKADAIPQFVYFKEGYAYPELPDDDQILTTRLSQVDGHAATLINYGGSPVGSQHRGMELLVSVSQAPIVFCVSTNSAPSGQMQRDREMQAILSSFHVERLAVDARGKR